MSSSSDLETTITQQVATKKVKLPKKKSKSKSKPTRVVAAPSTDANYIQNEGDDPHWAYAPPEGSVLLDHAVDAGVFEWGALKEDEDTEIWLIRAPDTIKPKHLNELEIDPPSSSHTALIGSLTRKTASYDVWSVHSATEPDADADPNANSDLVSAEELSALTCLLPRKRKKGKLYIAPKRIAHHIVITAKSPVATPSQDQPIVYQNPPRPSYPKNVFKHVFVPYGARSAQTRSEDVVMDEVVEMPKENPVSELAPLPKDKPAKTKESKRKKRKGDGESPKKSKKHKSDT